LRSNNIIKTDEYIVDLSPVSTKTTSMERTDGKSLRSDYTVTSHVDCKDPLLSSPKVIATSSATAMLDTVYAKARFYNGDGSLVNSDETTENNTNFASATAKSKASNIYYGDDYGYGNHLYEKEGYKTIIHETYDTFE